MQEVTEKELRIQQLRLIVFVMFTVFVVMLVYTIYWFVDYNKHYGFFTKTTAEVIEHKELDNEKYDVIKYYVDGNEYNITTEYPSDFEIGQNIKIYYDKNNPIGIVFSLDSRRITLPIITGLFGVGCVALVIVYILIVRSNKKGKIKSKNKNRVKTIE